MKNSIKLLAIFFIFCLSCSTDSNNDDDMNDPTDPTPLLKRTVTLDDSGDEYVINYLYNGNKLIGFNESDTFNTTYTYENDLVVRHDGFIGTLHEFYVIYEYDTNNRLTQSTVYFLLSGNSAIRDVYTYLPNNQVSTKSYTGDFTTQNTYSSEVIDTFSNGNWVQRLSVDYGDIYTYTYDTKNGALKNIHQAAIFQLLGEPGEGSTNNPTDFNNGEGERLEYVYDTNNYPVSSLTYLEGDNVPVASTQYFYQ